MTPNPKRRTHAFTLVELLVVIGIIAVLISILLPVLNRARESARQAQCLSNVRQLAAAGLMYAIDYKGAIVPSDTGSSTSLSETIDGVTGLAHINWNYMRVSGTSNVYSIVRGFLGQYTKTDKVFYCPSMADYAASMGSSIVDPLQPATTYAMQRDQPKFMGQVQISSETVWLADAISVSTSAPYTLKLTPYLLRGSLGAYGSDTFHGRHMGKGSVAFYDGHAEAVLAQVRPSNSYIYPSYTAMADVCRRFHIGPMTPSAIDSATLSSYLQYSANFSNQYDYYFWFNKEAKGMKR